MGVHAAARQEADCRRIPCYPPAEPQSGTGATTRHCSKTHWQQLAPLPDTGSSRVSQTILTVRHVPGRPLRKRHRRCAGCAARGGAARRGPRASTFAADPSEACLQLCELPSMLGWQPLAIVSDHRHRTGEQRKSAGARTGTRLRHRNSSGRRGGHCRTHPVERTEDVASRGRTAADTAELDAIEAELHPDAGSTTLLEALCSGTERLDADPQKIAWCESLASADTSPLKTVHPYAMTTPLHPDCELPALESDSLVPAHLEGLVGVCAVEYRLRIRTRRRPPTRRAF